MIAKSAPIWQANTRPQTQIVNKMRDKHVIVAKREIEKKQSLEIDVCSVETLKKEVKLSQKNFDISVQMPQKSQIGSDLKNYISDQPERHSSTANNRRRKKTIVFSEMNGKPNPTETSNEGSIKDLHSYNSPKQFKICDDSNFISLSNYQESIRKFDTSKLCMCESKDLKSPTEFTAPFERMQVTHTSEQRQLTVEQKLVQLCTNLQTEKNTFKDPIKAQKQTNYIKLSEAQKKDDEQIRNGGMKAQQRYVKRGRTIKEY